MATGKDFDDMPGSKRKGKKVPAFILAIKAAEAAARAPKPKLELDFELSDDQKKAWAKILAWIPLPNTYAPYFILRGFSGTGKSTLMRMLASHECEYDVMLTAPTNKAAKVLKQLTGSPAKTTFSALGLVMEEEEDRLVMRYVKDAPYIPSSTIMVVDEGSMVNRSLTEFVEKTRLAYGFKVMYVGDPAQLPPVGETRSVVWDKTRHPERRAFLKQVMRFDSQLLALSVRIRDNLKAREYQSPITDDHDENGGVYLLSSKKRFEKVLLAAIKSPADCEELKVIAWRNRTVDYYNDLIRNHLGFTKRFHVGDRLMMKAPVRMDKAVLASIDDEVVVTSIDRDVIRHDDGEEIQVYALETTGDVNLMLYVPVNQSDLDAKLAILAARARRIKGYQGKAAWREFFAFKERFHQVRYGYSFTSHRSQGSSIREVFVDQQDILANPEHREAMKCLYVSCTRATTSLYTF